MTTQQIPTPATAGAVLEGPALERIYEHPETRALVALVNDAAELVRTKGESAFAELAKPDSRWRQAETYVFVLDPDGNMLVHLDPALEGRNVIDLKDVGGKPIIRGLVDAATANPEKPAGWYHYQWPVPGGLLPRWKSSYVRLVQSPSGKRYVVGAGVYNDRMERAFVVDAVTNAVAEIGRRGEAAFPLLRDPTGPFIAKDAYVFVIDMASGVELLNPMFPSMEGRYVLDLRDPEGNFKHREMFDVVRRQGAGWVDYPWPKPGESALTQKSAYVTRGMLDGRPVVVGSGVYLAEAPTAARPAATMTAAKLTALVRDAAAEFEKRGEEAYAEFRTKGTRWFHDDVYFFVVTMNGVRTFVATEPENEGKDSSGRKDVLGRPFGRMIVDVGKTPSGEGWVHYMYPQQPGAVLPTWKSTFVKRVRFPSGVQHLIGCGVYDMQMDEAFIEDVVERAAALIAEHGRDAFPLLRDKTGPFVFMDTYVFVESPDGVELVNPAFPSLEGRSLWDLRDLTGKTLVRDEVALALERGSGWIDVHWYKPGANEPGRKHTFVRKVESRGETFVVGSGLYRD